MHGTVETVRSSSGHATAKTPQESITLRTGLGVEGDAHSGQTTRDPAAVPRDAGRPSVHLVPAELHDELRAAGVFVQPGRMGENITTRGVKLLDLPAGTRLHLGATAIVQVTGLRTGCVDPAGIAPGLMTAVLESAPAGQLLRSAGVTAVVVQDGEVRPGDGITVELPPPPYRRLRPV